MNVSMIPHLRQKSNNVKSSFVWGDTPALKTQISLPGCNHISLLRFVALNFVCNACTAIKRYASCGATFGFSFEMEQLFVLSK